LWPPLDLLQQVYVFSELDADLQVGAHQRGAERQNPLPRPAGHTAFDAAQDMVGLLGCASSPELDVCAGSSGGLELNLLL